jgi:hypothetical protein
MGRFRILRLAIESADHSPPAQHISSVPAEDYSTRGPGFHTDVFSLDLCTMASGLEYHVKVRHIMTSKILPHTASDLFGELGQHIYRRFPWLIHQSGLLDKKKKTERILN